MDDVDPLNGDHVDPVDPLNGDQDDVLVVPIGLGCPPNGVAMVLAVCFTVVDTAWNPFDRYLPTFASAVAISLFYLFFLFNLTHEIVYASKHR